MSKQSPSALAPKATGATLRFDHAAIGARPQSNEAGPEMPRALPSALSIPIDQVEPDLGQPRKTMDLGRLQELAESIKEHGILEPLLVREDGYKEDGRERYVIIAGGRRREAALLAGLTRLPAVLSDRQGLQVRVIQLLENLQREDLPEIEEARAIRELRAILEEQQGGKPVPLKALMPILHKSYSYIDERIKLLNHADVADAVESRGVKASTATLVAKIADDDARADLLRQVEENKLSRKDVQRIIRKRAVKVVDADDQDVGGTPTLREVAHLMGATEPEISFAAETLRTDDEISAQEALTLARHTPSIGIVDDTAAGALDPLARELGDLLPSPMERGAARRLLQWQHDRALASDHVAALLAALDA